MVKSIFRYYLVAYTREYEGEFDYITALDSDGTSYRYYAKQFHMHTPSEH